MTKYNRRRLIYLSLAFAFVALLVTSEAIYQLNNKSNLILPFYLNRASQASEKDDIQRTLFFLKKGAEIKLKEEAKKYPPGKVDTDLTITKVPEKENLQNSFKDYFEKLEFDTLSKALPRVWAKHFYMLGLIANNVGEPELAEDFFIYAKNLGPQWSYFHIELANFYFVGGKKDKAENQIVGCLEFESPRKHCQEFLDQNLSKKDPKEIGFLQRQIEDSIKN